MPDDADVILVLSGGTRYYGVDSQPSYMPNESSTNRALHAAQIYHQVGGCSVVVASGKDHYSRGEKQAASPEEALICNSISRLLLDLGVKRDDIILEEESRDTYENIFYSQKIIEEKGFKKVVLVTDAAHMRRSELCCRKLGLEVIPAPCNYESQAFELTPYTLIPSDTGIQQARNAAREYIGLCWYWLRGRI